MVAPIASTVPAASARLTEPDSHEGTKARPRLPAPRIRPEKAPFGAGKCDVLGIFVNDPAEVWNLPDTIVTEVRPPPSL